MKYIDLHCDTLFKHSSRRNTQDLYDNNLSKIDIKRLEQGENMAQFFAMFRPEKEDFIIEDIPVMDDETYFMKCSQYLKDNIQKYNDKIGFARNYEDLCSNEKEGKISGFLTVEDGRYVEGKLSRLKDLSQLGVSLITLTWNYENCFGHPHSSNKELMKLGLTDFGKEAIQYMNELGIIVDVSHLSDGGFYDCLEISTKPIIASHSNAREITPHTRNLDDDMIKKLADKGGIAGLNFCNGFLNQNRDDMSSIDDMILHLNHMVNKGGEDFVAIGSDFDGIENQVEITDCSKMQMIFQRLRKQGWSESKIEKIAYKSAMRVIKDILGGTWK